MQNLRVSAVVRGFLEEREVILGLGISFKTQRIWIQLVNLFLLAVLGQGQFTAYWEGLVLLIKLNTLCIFFILSLSARMKSKIQSLGSGAPPSCFGKATPDVYVLLGSCLALDSWKWWLCGCAGAPASHVVQMGVCAHFRCTPASFHIRTKWMVVWHPPYFFLKPGWKCRRCDSGEGGGKQTQVRR